MTTKKKSTKQPVEDRIYVFLPHTVQIPVKKGSAIKSHSVAMEPGRLMAQAAHVVSRMRMKQVSRYGEGPITTICLSVRNTKELSKVEYELSREGFHTTHFLDDNPAFYGTKEQVLTAVCTEPLPKGNILDEIIGHLELYAPLK